MKMLKYLILCCPLALFTQTLVLKGQEINRFRILIADSVTKKPIIGALVSCKNRLTYTMADKQGKVDLVAAKTDSIYIETQGYLPKKIKIEEVKNGQVRLVVKKPTAIDFKEIKSPKKIMYNDFNVKHVKHYVGFPNPFNPLPYLQVAQLFHNTAEVCMLEKITVAQLFFDNLKVAASEQGFYWYNDDVEDIDPLGRLYSRAYRYKDLQNATFRVRIYRMDDAGYPAEDLCNEEIKVIATYGDQIHVNLSKYKIMVPKGNFFIAIQWLPTIGNASQITYTTFSTTKLTGFKPFVGLQPINDKERTFFVKDYSGNWLPSPDKAKLAIAITSSGEYLLK